MKSLTQRLFLALVCAVGLAACGGSSGTLFLAGTVNGLTKDGLVLKNGSETLAVPAGSISFQFDTLLATDSTYNVTVDTQPTGAVCAVSYGQGTIGLYSISSVYVNCVTNSYKLGGSVSGLTGSGLVLTNGPDTLPVAAGATTAVFAKVADGAPYGISVLAQPTGQTCTVNNATGYMGSGDMLTAFNVTCI